MTFIFVYLLIGIASVLKSTNCLESKFGTIAGNKTLSQCISGGFMSTSDLDITTTELIKREGYPVEEHVVLTEDGYYLTLHRIPGGSNASPVFLQHGLVSSSFDWVVVGKGKGLGFILADHGYDVWLGNARGNTYSRCHTTYKTSQSEYWDFSFHEMAVFDLPAVINYITNLTKQRIIYVGYSLGTTISYILAIERPEIASKVKVLVSLAPEAYLRYGKTILQMTIPFFNGLQIYTKEFGNNQFLTQNNALREVIRSICFDTPFQRQLCVNLFFLIVGFDPPQWNYTLVPIIMSHIPAGTSMKMFTHFLQLRVYDRFQKYNYGSEENFRRYGSSLPPEYNLSKIKLPVATFWAQNDFLAHPYDVKRLTDRLPNLILNYKVELPEFNHLDFMYAREAFKYVYSKLLSVMEDFR